MRLWTLQKVHHFDSTAKEQLIQQHRFIYSSERLNAFAFLFNHENCITFINKLTHSKKTIELFVTVRMEKFRVYEEYGVTQSSIVFRNVSIIIILEISNFHKSIGLVMYIITSIIIYQRKGSYVHHFSKKAKLLDL